jgi:hypothetical protein
MDQGPGGMKMIKKFYVFAWLVLTGSAIASVFTGSLNELGMVVFGLIALVLVYAFALWVVVRIPEDAQPQ